jgi:hypothetical protein
LFIFNDEHHWYFRTIAPSHLIPSGPHYSIV